MTAAVISTAAVALVLHLWDADLGIPFAGAGDALFFQMLVKDTLDHGWLLTNPDLGWPFGQELYDYPVAGADGLHVVAIKVLGLFSSNPAWVLNTYFLLSFPLVAISAFGVMRWLGVSGPVAVAGAVLFSLAPYHFLRGEYHFFLSAYFTVPLGAYLILAVYLGRPLFGTRARTLVTLAICLAVGFSDLYYATFTAVLVAGATLIAALAARRTATLRAGAAVLVALGVATTLALAPTLVYRAQHGSNELLTRAADESEVFSLNLTELITPVKDHRIGKLASIEQRHTRAKRVGLEPTPLGLIAALGFVWLLAVSLLLCVGAAQRLIQDVRQRALAAAALTAFLIGTTGGVSAVIAYGITPQLRSWGRLSIFIAFFALAALALLADAAWRRIDTRDRRRSILALGALGAVMVIAVLDQTSPTFVPAYGDAAAEYRSDGDFVREIENSMDPGAAILQVPYIRFPDQREFARIGDYDPLRGYVHSDDLRWSYGAMKGRPQDWQGETVSMPLSLLLPMASAAGFDGVYLDRFAYADNGAAAEQELDDILGGSPMESANRRLAFFDMRAYNGRLRASQTPAELDGLADVTLHPVRAVFSSDDFFSEEREGVQVSRWSVNPESRVRLVNPSSSARSVVLGVNLSREGGDPATVTLRYPGGEVQRIHAQPAGTPVLRRLSIPPGESAIDISVAGEAIPGAPGGGGGFVKLQGLQLIPASAASLADGLDGG